MRETAELRLVVVCDRCGAECQEMGRLDYRPDWRRRVRDLAELSLPEPGLVS